MPKGRYDHRKNKKGKRPSNYRWGKAYSKKVVQRQLRGE